MMVVNVIGTIPKVFLQLFVVSCTRMHFETIRMQEDLGLWIVRLSDGGHGETKRAHNFTTKVSFCTLYVFVTA